MNEKEIADAAKEVALTVLLARVIAATENFDLRDPKELAVALMQLTPPPAIPEELQDHFRVEIRDWTHRVLDLAALMRRQGL